MHADFSAAAKAARAQIAVPPIALESIRDRSGAGRAKERFSKMAAYAALILGLGGAAAALADIGGGVHLWLSGNNVKALVESFTTVRDPMAPDVRRIVSSATFPIVFPLAVPARAQSVWIAYTPADKPDMVTIEYRDAMGKPYLGVSLVDNGKIRRDAADMPASLAQTVATKGAHWRIGAETVIVQGRNLTPAEIARMKSAMQHASAAQSRAAFEARLPKIEILQVEPRVAAAAERFAPPGRNVLFGKWDVGQISNLAARGKALRDSRTVHLTNIPQVHGAPDYRRATLQWARAIAVPVDGVRAVAAALRRTHVAPNCGCAILVNQSNGNRYRVWRIDAKTLKITPL